MDKVAETFARIQEIGMPLEVFKRDILNNEQAALSMLTEETDPNYIGTGLTGAEGRGLIEILKLLSEEDWKSNSIS